MRNRKEKLKKPTSSQLQDQLHDALREQKNQHREIQETIESSDDNLSSMTRTLFDQCFKIDPGHDYPQALITYLLINEFGSAKQSPAFWTQLFLAIETQHRTLEESSSAKLSKFYKAEQANLKHKSESKSKEISELSVAHRALREQLCHLERLFGSIAHIKSELPLPPSHEGFEKMELEPNQITVDNLQHTENLINHLRAMGSLSTDKTDYLQNLLDYNMRNARPPYVDCLIKAWRVICKWVASAWQTIGKCFIAAINRATGTPPAVHHTQTTQQAEATRLAETSFRPQRPYFTPPAQAGTPSLEEGKDAPASL